MKMTREKIDTYFNGKNFITPEVLERNITRFFVYELARGKQPFASAAHNDYIFGLTTYNRETRKPVEKHTKPFESLNEAYAYIDGVLKK